MASPSSEKKYGMLAPLVRRSMIGEKLTFHIPPAIPRSTASPDCSTNFTGNGVAELGKEVRDVGAFGQTLDDRREADVPHPAGDSAQHRVAGLQHELHGKWRR